MTTPRLKSLDCILRGDRLVISFDPKSRVELEDRSGQVRALLELLQQGTLTVAQLQAELTGRNPAVSSSEIEEAVAKLDALGWLEDACAPPLLNAGERERYASNLAFFDAFTSLQRSREALQHALLCAHVVVLGAGGLGSSVIQNVTIQVSARGAQEPPAGNAPPR